MITFTQFDYNKKHFKHVCVCCVCAQEYVFVSSPVIVYMEVRDQIKVSFSLLFSDYFLFLRQGL